MDWGSTLKPNKWSFILFFILLTLSILIFHLISTGDVAQEVEPPIGYEEIQNRPQYLVDCPQSAPAAGKQCTVIELTPYVALLLPVAYLTAAVVPGLLMESFRIGLLLNTVYLYLLAVAVTKLVSNIRTSLRP